MANKPNDQPREAKEPVIVESPVAPVESVKAEVTDPCWNCQAQLTNGMCSECGFDKSLLHNLKLEEERINEMNRKG